MILNDQLEALANEIVEMMPALMSAFILKKDFKAPTAAETDRKRCERVSNMQKGITPSQRICTTLSNLHCRTLSKQ
jgi:hypothetical protein